MDVLTDPLQDLEFDLTEPCWYPECETDAIWRMVYTGCVCGSIRLVCDRHRLKLLRIRLPAHYRCRRCGNAVVIVRFEPINK